MNPARPSDPIPMHRCIAALILAAALTLDAGAADAQSKAREPVVLARGARVRLLVSADEARRTGRGIVSGTLVSGDSALVVIMRRDSSRVDTVPAFTIDDVEMYTGQRSRPRMIIAGTAAGAAASGMIYAFDRLSRAHRCGSRNECPPLLPPGYYSIPIAVGAVFGSTFSASRWVAIPRRAVYISFGNSRSVELSAVVRFR